MIWRHNAAHRFSNLCTAVRQVFLPFTALDFFSTIPHKIDLCTEISDYRLISIN